MIFLVVCDFLMPITMMAIGLVYRNRFPKDINKLHGYRSTRSMKNQETWDFAQKTFGKVANTTGVIYRDDIESVKRANTEISRDILKIQGILTKKFIISTD